MDGNADNFNVSDYIVYDPETSINSSAGDVEYQARASVPTSPEAGPSSRIGRRLQSPAAEVPENTQQTETKRKKRYSQQDMFEYFRKESKKKRKDSKQCLMLLKSIAQSQNISVPSFDISSSSDFDY